MHYLKKFIPERLKILFKKNLPVSKKVRWGSFRNLQPFNRDFGAYVGTAVDRYYIEKFLHSQATFIRGNVLEIAETRYTEKFASGEYKAHALHLKKTGSENEIVGDLVTGKGLVSESFDCAIVTQTLPFIYDFRSAINNLKRILKPNGVLLATLSGISQVSRFDMDRWGDYWRFTGLSSAQAFAEYFPLQKIQVSQYGNALVATAFIQGIVAEELKKDELDYYDEDYPVSICVKASKN